MSEGHLPLPGHHELVQGIHRPAGAAGEREEWSCLLVARLKVCSIAERGAGDGRTSSSWSARGVGDGGQLECGEDWQLSRSCLTRFFAVLVERRVVSEMAIVANHHHR